MPRRSVAHAHCRYENGYFPTSLLLFSKIAEEDIVIKLGGLVDREIFYELLFSQ